MKTILFFILLVLCMVFNSCATTIGYTIGSAIDGIPKSGMRCIFPVEVADIDDQQYINVVTIYDNSIRGQFSGFSGGKESATPLKLSDYETIIIDSYVHVPVNQVKYVEISDPETNYKILGGMVGLCADLYILYRVASESIEIGIGR